MTSPNTTIGWRFTNSKLAAQYYPYSMGETAENLVDMYDISRQEQDEFALESQQKAEAGKERRAKEMIPVEAPGPKGTTTTVTGDEHPRPDTSAEKLAALPPVFRKDGSVTAGNSSGITDGAAAMVLMSESRARTEGREPLARIIGMSWVGVDPAIMGIGPVPATKRVLEKTGLSLSDIDVIEINEAFAAQVIACERDLKFDREKLNPKGGGIALGHPIGMSGARLVVSLLHELRRRGGRYGLATLCVGVGQGQTHLFLNFLPDRPLGIGFQPPGINQDEPVVPPGDLAQQPISSGSRYVGHNGLAAAQDPIKKGRLAHVGPSHNGNNRGRQVSAPRVTLTVRQGLATAQDKFQDRLLGVEPVMGLGKGHRLGVV
jgi:hypothetical protein